MHDFVIVDNKRSGDESGRLVVDTRSTNPSLSIKVVEFGSEDVIDVLYEGTRDA